MKARSAAGGAGSHRRRASWRPRTRSPRRASDGRPGRAVTTRAPLPWRPPSVVEARAALLLAGGDRLGEVLRGQPDEQLIAVLEVDGGLEAAGLEGRPQHLLRHGETVGAQGAQLLGDGERAGAQLV